MVLAVALLAATGYLAYKNLSSIVASINVDVGPGRKLMAIRDISMDLQKAENSFRMYSVTNNDKDLQPYYEVISGIDAKIATLRDECSDSPLLLAQTDTISRLIEENIYIWNELLYLNQNHQVIEYLKQLPERLNITEEDDEKSEGGILRRVFSRSEKNRVDEQALFTDLDRIEKEDQAVREKMKLQESHLASTSTGIKEQFHDLTVKMEDEVSEILRVNAYEADLLAGITYRWLAMFLASGVLLAILVVWIIARYVRKSEAYQVALQRSRDEAENLARTKEQFMANMSHEIRTPVTSISGFTEQLLHEPLDEKTLRKVNIIRSSSLHLERIINDILDFSKLQDGRMTLEQINFSIRQVADEVYSMFYGLAKKNNTLLNLFIDPEIPPVLLGDPYRLKQIMINLVSNSVKFTSDGRVSFSVSATAEKEGELFLNLEIADTGIGIEQDRIDSIFDDFTQEEMSTARKYGGTGLGLSIVRKLVDLHNGRLEIKSKKNHGTTVRCDIPYLTGDIEKLNTDTGRLLTLPADAGKLKVLIVDDEEYNRFLFRSILTRWGVRHDEAENGISALEMIRKGRYDLILMDMRMPGPDGAEITERIRNELMISDTEMPVICVSAALTDEDIRKYRISGMNAFLQKPFSEKSLADVILSVTGTGSVSGTDSNPADEEPGTDNLTAGFTTAAGEPDTDEVPDRIELSGLYRIAGGDEQFAREMLVAFMEDAERNIEEMTELVKTGNLNMLAEISHKLIPKCRHIGAAGMASILAEIEKAGRGDGNPGHIETMISSLRELFPGIRRQIEKHITERD